jgi:hypothetical protein
LRQIAILDIEVKKTKQIKQEATSQMDDFWKVIKQKLKISLILPCYNITLQLHHFPSTIKCVGFQSYELQEL